MRIKERLGEAFRLYFILVTLITVLLMVLGLLFDSDRTFGYEVFVSPLVYAAVGVIPVFFFKPDKEISMKAMILRRVIQELAVEAAILLIVFNAPSIPSERTEVVIAIAAGVLVVFVLAMIVEYIFELTQANEMNRYLEEYQKQE
ncbi:MAG: hypothetical protein K5697_12035 [Lachnospiraceae bacterium]|nr:hypothetical protein [Lachnospiraceae bacterium]